MVKTAKDVIDGLGFRQDKIKLTETEQQTISSSLENYIRELTTLFEIEYKEVSRLTTREFYDKFLNKTQTIEIAIINTEYSLKDSMERIDKELEIGKNSGIDKDRDPYYRALSEYRKVAAKLVASITHRILITQAQTAVIGRLMKIIEDVRKIDIEKMKAETDKNSFQELYIEIKKIMTDQKEEYKKQNDEYRLQLKDIQIMLEKERKHNDELRKTMNEMQKQVLNVDEEVIEKLNERDKQKLEFPAWRIELEKRIGEIEYKEKTKAKFPEPPIVQVVKENVNKPIEEYKSMIESKEPIKNIMEDFLPIRVSNFDVYPSELKKADELPTNEEKIMYLYDKYPKLNSYQIVGLFSYIGRNISLSEVQDILKAIRVKA